LASELLNVDGDLIAVDEALRSGLRMVDSSTALSVNPIAVSAVAVTGRSGLGVSLTPSSNRELDAVASRSLQGLVGWFKVASGSTASVSVGGTSVPVVADGLWHRYVIPFASPIASGALLRLTVTGTGPVAIDDVVLISRASPILTVTSVNGFSNSSPVSVAVAGLWDSGPYTLRLIDSVTGVPCTGCSPTVVYYNVPYSFTAPPGSYRARLETAESNQVAASSPFTLTALVPAGGCRVEFKRAWDTGIAFAANVTLVNTGPAITNWELAWNVPVGQQARNSSSTSIGQVGSRVTVIPSPVVALASNVPFYFGYNVTDTGLRVVPQFSLNGTPCVTTSFETVPAISLDANGDVIVVDDAMRSSFRTIDGSTAGAATPTAVVAQTGAGRTGLALTLLESSSANWVGLFGSVPKTVRAAEFWAKTATVADLAASSGSTFLGGVSLITDNAWHRYVLPFPTDVQTGSPVLFRVIPSILGPTQPVTIDSLKLVARPFESVSLVSNNGFQGASVVTATVSGLWSSDPHFMSAMRTSDGAAACAGCLHVPVPASGAVSFPLSPGVYRVVVETGDTKSTVGVSATFTVDAATTTTTTTTTTELHP
jgi:Cellulose binding domain